MKKHSLIGEQAEMQPNELSPYLNFMIEGPGYCQYTENMADAVVSQPEMDPVRPTPPSLARGLQDSQSEECCAEKLDQPVGQQRTFILPVPTAGWIFSSLAI